MKELIGLVVLLTHACFPQTMLLLLVSLNGTLLTLTKIQDFHSFVLQRHKTKAECVFSLQI